MSVETKSAAQEVEELRQELERRLAADPAPRWNADPDDVQRSVARLVLTLAEFIRQLLERQALRRMEAETLSAEEVEETLHDMAATFGLTPEDLNLDLGPLGRLL